MKRLPIYILLAALFCSCEYNFELDESSLENKLYVNCVAGCGDTTFVTVQRCVPVNKATLADKKLPDLEYLHLTLDGKDLPLKHMDDTIYNRWYTLEKMNAGSVLSIRAKASDTEEVNASCSLPPTPSIKSIKTDFCKTDESYLEFQIELEGTTEGYYAVEGQFRTQESAVYDPDYNPYESSDFEGDYITSYYGLYSNILPESSEILSERTEEYPGLSWDGRSLNGTIWSSEIKHLSLVSERDLAESKGILRFYIYYNPDCDEDAEYDIYDGGKVKYHHKRVTTRQFRIYRISPEFYYYASAQIAQDENTLGEIGLAPSAFSYTNIDGGFGVLASCAWCETPWMDNI